MLSETEMKREYKRTNIFIIDGEMWAWAQYRAKILGYQSVSEYIFDLIEKDREKIAEEGGEK